MPLATAWRLIAETLLAIDAKIGKRGSLACQRGKAAVFTGELDALEEEAMQANGIRKPINRNLSVGGNARKQRARPLRLTL
jgi:hypothetical protein